MLVGGERLAARVRVIIFSARIQIIRRSVDRADADAGNRLTAIDAS